ncbi:MAG: hypothetical protein WAS21_24075 [Geminicoccaceae bacterium]
MTMSYWEDVADMAAFSGGDPLAMHQLERDRESLIALPRSVQVLRLLKSHGIVGTTR